MKRMLLIVLILLLCCSLLAGAALAAEETEEEEKSAPISTGTIVVSILIGIVLAWLIPMSILKGQLHSVKHEKAAANYIRQDSMTLTENRDLYLYKNVTRVAKPKNNNR